MAGGLVMASASHFQDNLHQLATDIGEETLELYRENFGRDWPDEEATTGGLLGAFALSARNRADRLSGTHKAGLVLRAQLTRKSAEARQGGDMLIHFRCQEDDWKIRSSTLVQAKRHDRSQPFGAADHRRLTDQLAKMIRFTPESFVMLYSQQEGIHIVPALAACSLGSRSLFDLPTISWPRFLSGILRGRFGEPIPDRVPYPSEEWTPSWVLEVVAQMTRQVPRQVAV